VRLDTFATLLLTCGLIMMVHERAIDEPVVISLHREAYMAYAALVCLLGSVVLVIVEDVRHISMSGYAFVLQRVGGCARSVPDKRT
jgi:hypothetical protein